MAYQPIVNWSTRQVFAYEALVRGTAGEGAAGILAQVTPENRYAFDQACRVKAIETAAALGLGRTTARLSINFIPGAVYEPAACIRATLAAAGRSGLPLDRFIFEVTEGEKVEDPAHLHKIFQDYRTRGFTVAIDDFGAGYAGLNLLADFQPDILKIDMAMIRDIHQRPVARVIVAAILTVCRDLNIQPIAEGIETLAEARVLRDMGVTLFQGYLFGRPGFEQLPPGVFPD